MTILIGNNVVLWVLLSFSQLQLKNLHEDLSGRLEEALSIISEKVPFNDTSRYHIDISFLLFVSLTRYGSWLSKIISNLSKKTKLTCWRALLS